MPISRSFFRNLSIGTVGTATVAVFKVWYRSQFYFPHVYADGQVQVGYYNLFKAELQFSNSF